MEIFKEKGNIKIFKKFLFVIILLKNIPLFNFECSVEEPILKNNICSLEYCSKEEYSNGVCIINNFIIRNQWLNDIISLNDFKLRYNNFAINSNGDLILETSSQNNREIRLFYGLKKNGDFYFENENNEKASIKIMTAKEGETVIKRLESQNYFISLNNSEDNNEYLISISNDKNGYTELFDFKNDIMTYNLSNNFVGNVIFSRLSTFMQLQNENTNIKEYIFIYAGQDFAEASKKSNNYRMLLQKYAFYKNNLIFNDGYTYKEVKTNGYTSRVISCFQTDSNIIVVFYLTGPKKYFIRLFDTDLVEKYNQTIGEVVKIKADIGLYYYSIKIKENLGAFIYYTSNETYYPEFSIKEITNDYRFTNIFQLSLNYGYEFNNEPLYNNLIKLSDNRISYISTTKDRTKLLIILFNLYNNDQNMKIRIFKIDVLELYNYKFFKEIKTIVYNDYLSLSASVCDNNICNPNNSSENYFSIFLLFGYMNKTYSFIDISQYLIENKNDNSSSLENNIIIKLQEKAKIDNNIFGYEFSNEIKLITFPEELIFYNKPNSGDKILVNKNEILSYSHEISQNILIIKNNNTYFFEYQIITQENIEKINNYAIGIYDFPENPDIQENDESYSNNKYYGRISKVEFKLCYETCSECI